MIRKFTENDRELYYEMARQFYQSGAALHPVPEKNIVATFDEMMRSDAYVNGYMFEDNGEILGYGMTATTFSQESGGVVIWIEEIFVLPHYRGRGIGTEFLQFVDAVPGISRLRLEAEPDNDKAIELYSRMGYKPLNYLQFVKDK